MTREAVTFVRKVVLVAAGGGLAWMYASAMLGFDSELAMRVGSFFSPWILAAFFVVAFESRFLKLVELVDLAMISFGTLLQPIMYMHVYLRLLEFADILAMPTYSYGDMFQIMFFIVGSLFIVILSQVIFGYMIGQSVKRFW